MIRRKRKVLLHLDKGPSIEGLLVREGWRKDFVVWAPKVHDEAEDATVTVSGHVEVPRERVLFKQILD